MRMFSSRFLASTYICLQAMHFLPFSALRCFLMPPGDTDGKPFLSAKEGISTPEYKELGWDNVCASDPISENTSQVLFTTDA